MEFTTQRQQGLLSVSEEQRMASGEQGEQLLEELGTDERGTSLIARETLTADTFEIAVPLKVYGAADVDSVGSGRNEALEV